MCSLLLSTTMVAGMAVGSVQAEDATVNKAFEAFEEPVTVKCVMGYSEATKEGVTPSNCYWNEACKEYFNIDMEWLWEVPNEQYATKLSAALAAGQYPDILKCDFETYHYLLESGALADLTDVWEEYASPALKKAYAMAQDSMDSVTVDGKLMAIPYANDPMISMMTTYYRTDWLENVGLEMPTNIEELTAVIKAFRDNDPDGNGEQDTYALALNGTDGLTSYFNAFGAYPKCWIEKDGQIVNGLIQDETKEALDWLRELYADGYIDPEFATLSYEQMQSLVADGKAGIRSGQWWEPDGNHIMQSIANNPTATWGVQGIIGKEAGDVGRSQMSENGISAYNVVLVTASEEAKIAMIKMLNLFYDCYFWNEEDGSSLPWYRRAYSGDSEEYQAIEAKDYAWYLPVNLWNPVGTYQEFLDTTVAYNTGEISTLLSGGSETTEQNYLKIIDAFKKGYFEGMTDTEVELYVNGFKTALTRMTTEELGQCSIDIISSAKEAGNYVLNVFYGSETETGVAVASTLDDYAQEYMCKYIMGTEAEDSWDGFVSGWLAMGGEDWTNEVNEAYNAIH